MGMRHFRSRRFAAGFTLIGTLVTLSLMGLTMWATGAMLVNSGKAERGISANLELSEIASTLQMLFESNGSCAKSGLIGLTIDPSAPDTNPIKIHLPGATGPGPVYLEEEKLAAETRKVTKVRFTGLAPVGDSIYFATLTVSAEVHGKALTFRSPTQAFYLKLVLDSSNQVTDCYRNAGGGGGGGGLSCQKKTSGWGPWANGATKSVSCPANYTGVSCIAEYYDTNSGVTYHGGGAGVWNSSRTQCSLTSSDEGISEGEVTAECCQASGGGASFSGIANVQFNNGNGHSEWTEVSFPFPCDNPVVVTQSAFDSIACSDASNPSVLGFCTAHPVGTATSQDIHSYYALTTTGFKVLLSGMSGVCTGVSGAAPPGTPCFATSPLYPVAYHVKCN